MKRPAPFMDPKNVNGSTRPATFFRSSNDITRESTPTPDDPLKFLDYNDVSERIVAGDVDPGVARALRGCRPVCRPLM